MMLGSTQKLNDVYKAVRTNMPLKILLQLGEEEVMTLDKAYNFAATEGTAHVVQCPGGVCW